jgi:dihydroorotase-like cyclic amidohydrolase
VSTRTPMNTEDLEEMGPVDYIVIEWPDRQPTGEAAPIVADLVDRGIIRVLDLAFIIKAQDGTVAALEIEDLAEMSESFKLFEGASSGLLGDDDIQEAAKALEPGTSAALLVFENRWAAPFASAIRRSGGQLVANGRIPVQAVLAALEAAEQADSATTTS